MKHQLTFAVMVLSIAMLGGCSGTGDRPDLAQVEGTITVDDQPADGIFVVFKKEGFRSAQAVSDSDGRYRLRYIRDIMGGPIGENLVTFRDNTSKRRIPDRYQKEPQRVTVKSGSNEIDFTLTSK